ncbi:MAG TPA: helix-turn-helix domain-containing protein [Wenzhouxiangella sp.]|nr:helix-turn-helix domain-containing protein [Wenzhouxiangella sp.]
MLKPQGGSAAIDHHPATQRGHLDKKLIVTTAQEIIQREGLSALTMRRLGEALHVDASAMYRHFANKSALLTALFEELFSSLEPPDPSQSWRKNLSTLMHTWWQIYHDNREIAAKLTKSPKADTGRTMLKQWVMTELARAGIRPDAQQQYGQLVWAHVMSYGLLAATQDAEQHQVEEAFTFSVELLLDAVEEGSGHAQPDRA